MNIAIGTDAYNAWSLLLQVIIGFAIVATFVVYLKQLRAMRNGSVGQNLITLQTFMTEKDFRNEKKALFELEEKKIQFEQWTEEDRQNAEKVCAKYNLVAVILSKDVVPFKLCANELRYSMTKCHRIAKPLLNEVRRKRDPELWAEFSRIVKRIEGMKKKLVHQAE